MVIIRRVETAFFVPAEIKIVIFFLPENRCWDVFHCKTAIISRPSIKDSNWKDDWNTFTLHKRDIWDGKRPQRLPENANNLPAGYRIGGVGGLPGQTKLANCTPDSFTCSYSNLELS